MTWSVLSPLSYHIIILQKRHVNYTLKRAHDSSHGSKVVRFFFVELWFFNRGCYSSLSIRNPKNFFRTINKSESYLHPAAQLIKSRPSFWQKPSCLYLTVHLTYFMSIRFFAFSIIYLPPCWHSSFRIFSETYFLTT